MPDFGDTDLRRPAAPLPFSPLRLAFVSHSLRPQDRRPAGVGGLERAAAELLAALGRREDVEVMPVLVSAMTDPLRFAAFSVAALRQLGRLARAGAIDVVLFAAMPTAWMSVLLEPVLRRCGVSSAAICHGHDVIMGFPPYQRLVRRTFAALDAVMPVSRATAERCLARGLDPGRLHVTPNGADSARFAPAPPPEARRAILKAAFPREAVGLQPEDRVITSVGRLVPRKGHAWFVREVMPRLPASARLWLAGDGPEGPAIDAAVASSGVAGRVLRLGALSENHLAALYRGADLFVMPNLSAPGDIEGFGLVLLEASLNGLPVVSADLDGMADIIVDGVNGRLAPAADGAAFAAIVQQLAVDENLRRRLASSAEAHVRARFSWDAVAQSHLDILRHLDVLRRYQTCHPNLASIGPLPIFIGGSGASRDQGDPCQRRVANADRLRPVPAVREQRPGGLVGPQAR